MGHLAPGEIFQNMLRLKRRIENSYFHIEIVISATEMLGGSGTCSPRKF